MMFSGLGLANGMAYIEHISIEYAMSTVEYAYRCLDESGVPMSKMKEEDSSRRNSLTHPLIATEAKIDMSKIEVNEIKSNRASEAARAVFQNHEWSAI